MKTVILTCSSLYDYVADAQKKMNTSFDVVSIDKSGHNDPEKMKETVKEAIDKMGDDVDTVLVAMAFCGGTWDHVSFDKKIVIPRCDDCVSILLQKGDEYIPNLKEMGHLYLYEMKPEDFSALYLVKGVPKTDNELSGLDPDFLRHMMFDNYHYVDIIDTGLNNCYDEHYVELAQENADQINAVLGYVEGSNHLLEKLVSGKWDEQFLVAEPMHIIKHSDFFG